MMQRLRVTFARAGDAKYIAHLDMMRFWERAFRRAKLQVARTQGFHPHPRIAVASPLPVGSTGEAELMDVYLDDRVEPLAFYRAVTEALVPGIRVTAVTETPVDAPALQALIRFAEYRVTLDPGTLTCDQVHTAVAALLEATNFPWEHVRDGEARRYDLRAQVAMLAVESCDAESIVLSMRLQCDAGASGRPEQVVRAIGFDAAPAAVHRTLLVLADPPLRPAAPARAARL
jgi:radical SAM-linked protein